jgi:L-aspartate oxidase
MDCCDSEVVIVGAGAAGLCAALDAAPRRVLLIAPEGPGSTCTELARGGIAAPIAAGDSVALHLADTMLAADHSGCERAAGLIIGMAAEAIKFLERCGVQFDASNSGKHLHLEAGHRLPRILHVDGDRTGAAIHRALLTRVLASQHVALQRDVTALSLLRGSSGVAGVLVRCAGGSPLIIRAAETVLATGGLGQMFAATTNAGHASGDGLAMALAQDANTAGLEFVQFHPTALRCDADPLPLLTEALRGAGATLAVDGRRFMPAIDPRAELAPRDVVARAVWRHQHRGGQVLLDARSVFNSTHGKHFPAALAACLAHGMDPARMPVPVTCAAHFHMGGIAIDAHGRTNIPGLWAAGEVAYTGVHGANRLASNSLLEAVVIGCAVGRAISAAQYVRRPIPLGRLTTPAPFDPRQPEWQGLRALMWEAMGPVRHAAQLQEARSRVRRIKHGLEPDQITIMQRLALAEAMISSALRRRESRGAHWRHDFTQRDRTLDGAQALFGSRNVQPPRPDRLPSPDRFSAGSR